MPAGETQACCLPCWQQGSCSLGGQWSGGRGGGTSDQQVLAKGDQDWWHLPDGAESASAGFHRRCWVQPGTELWCLIDTTGFSDHRTSSWHGPCLLMGPDLFPWVGSSLPRTEGWQLGCQTPTLGHSHHHSLPHAQPRPMYLPLQLHDHRPRALLAPVGSGQSGPSDPDEEGPGWPDRVDGKGSGLFTPTPGLAAYSR